MNNLLRFVLIGLVCGPAVAQTLSERYAAMGQMQVVLADTEYAMVIPWDREKARGYASERKVVGRRTVNVLGSVVGASGKPGHPRLQLTFFVRDGEADFISMEVFDEQGFRKPLTSDPAVGSADFTAFSMTDDTRIEASVEGTLVRMDNTDAAKPVVVAEEGQVPVKLSLTVDLAPPN